MTVETQGHDRPELGDDPPKRCMTPERRIWIVSAGLPYSVFGGTGAPKLPFRHSPGLAYRREVFFVLGSPRIGGIQMLAHCVDAHPRNQEWTAIAIDVLMAAT